MDYEKLYKEALERAESMYEEGMMPERLEYLFPELKENEDEKIRKEIIDYVIVTLDDESSSKDRWLAWLEKQKSIIDEEYEQGKKGVLWCIEQAMKNAKDENEMGTCWFAEKWLEKQGEKKPVINDFQDFSHNIKMVACLLADWKDEPSRSYNGKILVDKDAAELLIKTARILQ